MEKYIVYKRKHMGEKAFTLEMTLKRVVWKQTFQINFKNALKSRQPGMFSYYIDRK